MKLVPYEKKKLYGYKLCGNQEIIKEFLESGMDCAKLEGYSQKNADSARSSLLNSMKRMGIHNVSIVVRKGEVFLLKTGNE